MRKIVTAHLGNKVFQIEEDAYAYLNKSLYNKRYEGLIETEVADLLAEKINMSKQVITFPDVVEVLYQLGFSASEMQENTYKPEKKLYRQAEGKMLGGICTGLGDFFEIDPVFMRIIFTISAFFATVGIWIYLIMWIIVPQSPKALKS